jgi:hypothetical protein
MKAYGSLRSSQGPRAWSSLFNLNTLSSLSSISSSSSSSCSFSTRSLPPLHPYDDASRDRMLPLPSAHDTYETITRQFKWPTPPQQKYNIGRDICDKHVAQGRGQVNR